MDLAQLADLGEFIGGIAVLATLVYLAAQVRQGTRAQQQANELAKADAMHRSVGAFANSRQMLADESMSALWFKALNEEQLTPPEEQRLFVLLQDITFSAVAALATQQAVGNTSQAETTPAVIAREMRGSRTLQRIWSPLADDLVAYGLADFASAVKREFEAEEARS